MNIENRPNPAEAPSNQGFKNAEELKDLLGDNNSEKTNGGNNGNEVFEGLPDDKKGSVGELRRANKPELTVEREVQIKRETVQATINDIFSEAKDLIRITPLLRKDGKLQMSH
ncbi:MAG: hypothetical protein Q8P54_00920 [bacterium]|nr:hypothetical protein [bacterium]